MEELPAGQNAVSNRFLTREEFRRLSDVPPEAEWFANIDNANTRAAYRNDVGDFVRFAGIERPEELRQITRAHVLKWRKSLEDRLLSPASIRRRLSSLSALFNCLCERNAIEHNPVQGGHSGQPLNYKATSFLLQRQLMFKVPTPAILGVLVSTELLRIDRAGCPFPFQGGGLAVACLVGDP